MYILFFEVSFNNKNRMITKRSISGSFTNGLASYTTSYLKQKILTYTEKSRLSHNRKAIGHKSHQNISPHYEVVYNVDVEENL